MLISQIYEMPQRPHCVFLAIHQSMVMFPSYVLHLRIDDISLLTHPQEGRLPRFQGLGAVKDSWIYSRTIMKPMVPLRNVRIKCFESESRTT